MAGDLDKANDIISGGTDDDKRRERVRERSKSRTRVRKNPDRSDGDSYRSYDYDDGGSQAESDAIAILAVALTFPWTGPYVAIEGDAYPGAVGFRDYPYQDGTLGHVVYADDEDEAFARTSSGRIALGVGYMGNDGWRASARARWMHNSRFDFDVNTIGFGEFDDGDLDAATFFSTHVGYRFVETDTFTMRSGIGGSLWQTQGLWAGGFDLYYGFDWFLVEPIVFSLNMELGSLGEAFRFGFQGSMGALIGRTELYLGWEHFVLTNEVGSVELGGPQAGVRLWL